jgi:hypothetical protein
MENPYGVLNTDAGFHIYKIDGISERFETSLVCRLCHDTSRVDPTLVLDTLMETHDPQAERRFWVHQFVAFFPTLETAIEAVDKHELRYQWERDLVENTKKALEQAQRQHRAAQQSQRYTVACEFDSYKGLNALAITHDYYSTVKGM